MCIRDRQNIFKNLRGKGRLTEEDVKVALKEVKIALLEADVNFKVVKDFIKKVNERAIGQDVLTSLTPGPVSYTHLDVYKRQM